MSFWYLPTLILLDVGEYIVKQIFCAIFCLITKLFTLGKIIFSLCIVECYFHGYIISDVNPNLVEEAVLLPTSVGFSLVTQKW